MNINQWYDEFNQWLEDAKYVIVPPASYNMSQFRTLYIFFNRQTAKEQLYPMLCKGNYDIWHTHSCDESLNVGREYIYKYFNDKRSTHTKYEDACFIEVCTKEVHTDAIHHYKYNTACIEESFNHHLITYSEYLDLRCLPPLPSQELAKDVDELFD